MHRRPLAASILVAVLLAAGSLPSVATPAAAVTGSCGTYRSETVPPPTIRVYRTATGGVDTVDFRTYVKNVLSREWISSWTTESLRSGALAVKHYAWYQVRHWRGYVNASGECFDVFDSTRDQHYDPSRPTYASMATAVDATWSTLALRNGRLFPTYYNAGRAGEPCGANANGWQMFQWGTQACGLAGRSAAQILATYYVGVTVSAAPAGEPDPHRRHRGDRIRRARRDDGHGLDRGGRTAFRRPRAARGVRACRRPSRRGRAPGRPNGGSADLGSLGGVPRAGGSAGRRATGRHHPGHRRRRRPGARSARPRPRPGSPARPT